MFPFQTSEMMDASKRTKRVRDASESMSLEEHIASKRAELVRARKEAPALRGRGEDLRKTAEAMTGRWQRRAAMDLRMQADALDTEAAVRESMSREHAFEATVVTYLRTYHRKCTDDAPAPTSAMRKHETIEAYTKHAGETEHHRATILDEYLTEMNRAPAKVAMAARDVCPRCEDRFVLCNAKSIMSCKTCGYAVTYLDATVQSTSFQDVVDYSPYSYKRVNHWMMYLTLCQAKEAHRVPDEILRSVMEDLYVRQNVRSPDAITQKNVRETLRKLRLRKAYDHVAQITSRLSGKPPMRIPPETEEQLRNMFLQMMKPFQRHAPSTRTNFLSYPYVLYRCFQILGMNHMLDGISLLKGREKLEINDAIFRKMCVEDLGWPVFELPPEE